MDAKRVAIAEKALADGNGIVRLEPAWVARHFLKAGLRLGLSEAEANKGERGYISERWLASETKADNPVGPPDEGLSFLALDGERMTLPEFVQAIPDAVLGTDYAAKHGAGLHRLAKLFDYAERLPYHLHQRQEDAAKVGATSKEEAYFFPSGVETGKHPETFIGCHPWIVREGRQEEVFLPYLTKWDSDLILQQAPAFLQTANDGFHVPAGILHAPGTALTIELQENSDVFAMWQAVVGGYPIAKELLFKDVPKDERAALGERAALAQADWALNGDPLQYEHRHTPPLAIRDVPEGREEWIFYNTPKFSGKRLTVKPGKTLRTKENGAFSLFVWRGEGTIGGHAVKGQDPAQDELLVTHAKATDGIDYANTGTHDLEVLLFFGKDVNPDCPRLQG